MLSVTYANVDDVAFIISVQELPHVQRFIRQASAKDIAARLNNPDETYLLARDDVRGEVGFAYLRGLQSPNKSVELCEVAIGKAGMGYGGQFLSAILSLVFNDLDKNRVWLDVFPENSNAWRLYKQHGFVEEGMLREAYFWKGNFQSSVLMSLLATEFRAMGSHRQE